MSDKDCKDFEKQIEKIMKKAEKEYLNRVAEMGCYVCSRPAEIHHIRHHTGLAMRSSHYETIPLCPQHHRFGKVSVHLGKKEFIRRYGTEQQILAEIRRRLDES
jgi:hypothetical protein